MRTLLILAILGSIPAMSAAQEAPPNAATRMQRAGRLPLEKEQRLRYIAQQLGLDADQQQHVEGLIELYKTRSNTVPDLEQIRVVASELEAEKKKEGGGDPQRIAELTRRLQDFNPIAKAESEFYAELMSILTPEQKGRLEQAKSRLESNPDGSYRPIEVYRFVQRQKLSDEQKAKWRTVLLEHRDMFKDLTPAAIDDEEMALTSFITKTREILTPEQAKEFDDEVNRLRAKHANLRPVPIPPPAGQNQPTNPPAPTGSAP